MTFEFVREVVGRPPHDRSNVVDGFPDPPIGFFSIKCHELLYAVSNCWTRLSLDVDGLPGGISIIHYLLYEKHRYSDVLVIVTLLVIWLGFLSGGPATADKDPSYTVAAARSGTGVMTCGKWTMVSCNVLNPTDRPVEVLAASYFDGQPTLQYARRFWVPPQAKRTTWYPIRPPYTVDDSVHNWTIHTMLFDVTDGSERSIKFSSKRPNYESFFPISREFPVTGMIDDEDDEADGSSGKIVRAARVSRNLTMSLANLRSTSMPPLPETLQGIDQLVIASDSWREDPAAMVAIRRWLIGGGRAWIMLDKVDASTLPLLLGEAFHCDVVDRVLLDRFQILDDRGKPDPSHGKERVFDNPPELVRVVTANVKMMCTVNGWPAAFVYQIGDGEAILTTLEAKAWFRRRTKSDPKVSDAKKRLNVIATEPLTIIAERFLAAGTEPPLTPDHFRKFTSEAIGYRIVRRSVVSAVLVGFCGLLALLGWILARRHRAAWMGWLGPGLALAAGVVLFVVGGASRRSVPRTAAMGQWVELTDSVADVRMSGVLAFYDRQRWESPIGSTGGGFFVPDAVERSGTTCRMVWTDLDRWQWKKFRLGSTVEFAPFTYTTSTKRPWVARMTFGPEGLVGRVEGSSGVELSDAILAGNGGRLRVLVGDDGELTARSTDVLDPGQFLGSSTVSDEQRRRQSVLKQYFSLGRRRQLADRVSLLGWTNAWEMPFVLNNPEQRVGEALIVIPLRLERPIAGTNVSIPAALINYHAVARSDGTISAAYSMLENQWVQMISSTNASLRFQLPVEVLPLQVRRAIMSIKINAPKRQLEIVGHNEGSEVVLAESSSPVDIMQFTLDEPAALHVDESGGLVLTVRVGKHPDEEEKFLESVVGWKIDDLSLQVDGVVAQE